MGKKPRKVTYVVTKGRKPGLYYTWEECKAQVHGFPGCDQHGFTSLQAAEEAWAKYLLDQSLKSKASENSDNLNSEFRLPFRQNLLGNAPEKEELNLKRSRVMCDPTESDAEEHPASKKRQYDRVEEGYNCGDEIVSLSAEQQAVVDAALRGHNIFLTGAAGCGKTVTLKTILASFKSRRIKFRVVAPTGKAALPLGGKTTYSFLGWTPNSLHTPIDKLIEQTSKSIKKTVRAIRILIIEEISMVENQILERMNLVMQSILKDPRPFGGKQVIITGDFHQLPPVKAFEFCLKCGRFMTKSPEYTCKDCPDGNAEVVFHDGDKWAFRAPVWNALKLKNIRLQQIHRQKKGRFQDILNNIRNGLLLEEDEWQDLETKKGLPVGICAVRLMSRRKDVDELNRRELGAIDSPAKSWQSRDSYEKLDGDWEGNWIPWEIDRPLKNHSFQECLTLKIGAKVVLLINLEPKAGLVNGSQGEVIDFKEIDDIEPGTTDFEPLIRRQGGKFRSNFEPVVRFSNGEIKTISPVKWASRCGTNQRSYLAGRTQIPLMLAWGLSIHKSQGMTLDYVDVSSKDLFEPGQQYVGLSRGTSLDGVTLSGNSRKQLEVDPDVLNFYENTTWATMKEIDCLLASPERVAGEMEYVDHDKDILDLL